MNAANPKATSGAARCVLRSDSMRFEWRLALSNAAPAGERVGSANAATAMTVPTATNHAK